MSRIRAKNTGPERATEVSLRKLKIRFRKHHKELPGTPDFVLSDRKSVLFVHGCFWHQHGCKRSTVPKSNIGYWKLKLLRNISRFASARRQLNVLGWSVHVAWECRIKKCPDLNAWLTRRLA